MAQDKYKYAQLPVFKYQTFDRESLQFSDIPIIPPNAKAPVVHDDDADEPLKEGDGPMDAQPEVEILNLPDLDLEESAPDGTTAFSNFSWYRGNTEWTDPPPVIIPASPPAPPDAGTDKPVAFGDDAVENGNLF